jgi:hypothetical protein
VTMGAFAEFSGTGTTCRVTLVVLLRGFTPWSIARTLNTRRAFNFLLNYTSFYSLELLK